MIALYRLTLEEVGGTIDKQHELPTVVVDKRQFQRLFQNLIGNALKFRSDRRPEIHVGAEYVQGEWVFSVRDNGIGFDMRFHDRIFNIFQRLQRAEDYPGTGIGLAIVRKAMTRMGGRVSAESTPNEGTCFRLELPR